MKAPLPHLTDEELATARTTTEEIAHQINEQAKGPQAQVWRIVRVLGREDALSLLAETQRIEASGGIMLPDESRRRTPGGVYFYLARQRLKGHPALTYVFPPRNAKKPKPKSTTSPTEPTLTPPLKAPPAPTFTWTEREPLITEALQNSGGSTTMKVTLVGRPGKIIEKDQFIMTAMPAMKIPSLPKGVPVPPEQTQTQVLVYIAQKQWKRVAEAITNPEDALIVEGFGVYDPQIKGIAILASNVTTKFLQQNKRQETAAP